MSKFSLEIRGDGAGALFGLGYGFGRRKSSLRRPFRSLFRKSKLRLPLSPAGSLKLQPDWRNYSEPGGCARIQSENFGKGNDSLDWILPHFMEVSGGRGEPL